MTTVKFGVMHDIETLSKRKDAAIVSIGAVKFTDKEIIDTFYVNIDPRSCNSVGLCIDLDTVEWWKTQKPEAWESLKTDRKSLTEALQMYAAWYGPRSVWTWGNGAEFDNVIIENAYTACGMEKPWKFWDSMCYRTVVNLTNSRLTDADRQGIHHNALDDAKSQALNLIKVLNK